MVKRKLPLNSLKVPQPKVPLLVSKYRTTYTKPTYKNPNKTNRTAGDRQEMNLVIQSRFFFHTKNPKQLNAKHLASLVVRLQDLAPAQQTPAPVPAHGEELWGRQRGRLARRFLFGGGARERGVPRGFSLKQPKKGVPTQKDAFVCVCVLK